MATKRILPQMFDVRPVSETGDLHWEKIQSVGRKSDFFDKPVLKKKTVSAPETKLYPHTHNAPCASAEMDGQKDAKLNQLQCPMRKPVGVGVYRFGQPFKSDEVPIFNEVSEETLSWIEEEKQKKIEELKKIEEAQMRMEAEWRRAALERQEIKRQAEKQRLLEEKIRKEKEQKLEAERLRRIEIEKEEKEWLRIEKEQKKIKEEIAYFLRVQKEEEERKQAELEREKEAELRREEQRIYSREDLYVDDDKKKISNKPGTFWKEIKTFRKNIFSAPKFSMPFDFRRQAFSFAAASLVVVLAVGTIFFVGQGLGIKGKVLGVSENGYANLASAMSSVKNQDFQASSLEFEKSYQNFSEASKDLDHFGSFMTNVSSFLPYASKLSSGKSAVEAGKHISLAGKYLNNFARQAMAFKEKSGKEEASLLDLFSNSEENLKNANSELKQAQNYLDKIKIDDLPEDKRDEFILLKQKLPTVTGAADEFLNNSYIFRDLLGGNGPRKFLFLFQNNQEMRATGGFVGSYGILDISNGHVRNFFVDGIFNPDGQLVEKIVPPTPIQKISAAWSLHDSNWFPDFPVSAQKAILFYEKTGGPTADGVITFTPRIMENLLEATGPVEMKDYGVTLTAENFVEETQNEVEADYDKKENKPKKILSDLASILIERLLSTKDSAVLMKALGVFSEGLSRKDILFYSTNEDLQAIISTQGWSGEMLSTPNDYLSVINANINGYKTDGVVDEKIEHAAKIQEDGSVIDTVTITRHHNGGNFEYEWWNKVNADYMRVYVPQGSKLISVEGQTREFNKPPLDYDALGFKRDPDVEREEKNMHIDENTGTRTYDESGKTVFANWVYVSPQETVVVKYTYLLPFKVSPETENADVDSYSLLAQKQSGSRGSDFSTEVSYDEKLDPVWSYPDDFKNDNAQKYFYSTKLESDQFFAATFKKNN